MPRSLVGAGAWLEKAMEHRDAVAALLDRSPPLIEFACFHTQQCVEKSLKAVLVRRKIEFPGTHDISVLLDLLGTEGPPDVPRHTLLTMSDYADTLGLPGGNPPTYDELDGIIDAMDSVLGWAQRELG